MSKTISFSLSTDSITRAIRELKQYKKGIEQRTQDLAKRIAQLLEQRVGDGFGSAVADIYWSTDSGTVTEPPDCTIGVDGEGNAYVVWARGQDAFFVEFGTGVYYNGSAGGSPHPKGVELGFTIGSYDKGYGRKRTWGFRREGEDTLYLSHGVPAAMPMYKATQEVAAQIEALAEEVFSS